MFSEIDFTAFMFDKGKFTENLMRKIEIRVNMI